MESSGTNNLKTCSSWYRPPEQITSIFDHVEIAASLLNQPATKSSVLFLRVQNLGLCSIFSIHCPAATYVIPYQRRILYTTGVLHQPHLQHLEYVDQPFRLHLADGQASSIKCPIGVLGRLRGFRGDSAWVDCEKAYWAS